jgi:hypothetical protein
MFLAFDKMPLLAMTIFEALSVKFPADVAPRNKAVRLLVSA